MKLHEVELFTKDPQASRKFYRDVVGLDLHVPASKEGLNVFPVGGGTSLDFDTSVHSPGRASVSFLVDDLYPIIARFREQSIEFTPPEKDHTGLPTITLNDPDGNIVVLHGEKPLPELDQE